MSLAVKPAYSPAGFGSRAWARLNRCAGVFGFRRLEAAGGAIVADSGDGAAAGAVLEGVVFGSASAGEPAANRWTGI